MKPGTLPPPTTMVCQISPEKDEARVSLKLPYSEMKRVGVPIDVVSTSGHYAAQQNHRDGQVFAMFVGKLATTEAVARGFPALPGTFSPKFLNLFTEPAGQLTEDQAQALLYEYREVLEEMTQRGDHASNPRHLPANKERIKEALLLIALRFAKGDPGRTDMFTSAYLTLSRFQAGIRDGQTSMNLAVATTSAGNHEPLENYTQQMEKITAEEAALRGELKAQGFAK